MRVLLLAILAVTVLGNFALWALPNRPQPLEPPPGGKLQSVSFAPFHDGQSPLTMVYPTKAQIEEICKRKMEDLNARDLDHAKRMIEGTARSMGVVVEG